MPLPFRIFKVRGDGSLHFVEEAHTLEDARVGVGELARLWPSEYIIQNEGTESAWLLLQAERRLELNTRR